MEAGGGEMSDEMCSAGACDLLAPLHPFDPLPRFVRASGASYFTADGREFVDFNEMRVVLGQGNEAFTQAVTDALRTITAPKNTYAPAKEQLISLLDQATDSAFMSVHLTSSGSEAAESAVRLAQKLTGRSEICAFWNSIHGRTCLSASMSGKPQRKKGYAPLAPGVVFLPYPDCCSCPMKCVSGCGFACLEMASRIYETASAQDACAVIVEPYQGSGVVMPPKGYLRALQDWARERGMLFIVDEIQSGMGRTGSMFRYQQEGLEPDILLVGKALGNGLHIAAVLSRRPLAKEHLHVFAGGSGDDALACAAACEVFRQLEAGLLWHVQTVSHTLRTGLATMEAHSQVLACRSCGLAAAVVLREEGVCSRVHAALTQRGFLLGRQESIIFLKPPYVVTNEQVSAFLKALEQELDACGRAGISI